MEFFVWLSMLSTLFAPHLQAGRFNVDGDTTIVPRTVIFGGKFIFPK